MSSITEHCLSQLFEELLAREASKEEVSSVFASQRKSSPLVCNAGPTSGLWLDQASPTVLNSQPTIVVLRVSDASISCCVHIAKLSVGTLPRSGLRWLEILPDNTTCDEEESIEIRLDLPLFIQRILSGAWLC